MPMRGTGILKRLCLLGTLAAIAACDKIEDYLNEDSAAEQPAALYQSAPVARRDITVAVQAAGIVEPVTTVEVKSKASGEILSLPVDTGDVVEAGTLLAHVDRRVLDNSLQQAKAGLDVSRARLANAESSLDRITKLYEQGSLSKSDWEQSLLDHATAKSDAVRSQIQVENATIALDDADVVSPITGTVIERLVEQGQVISSPMGDVGGGTLLMKMADLSHVQVRMLVDEIDIGKVQPGVNASVKVAAYADRPFEGEVVKVEPQAVTQQNVTMFPVLIDLENREGLLKPGMNAEVEVLIARRIDVPTIPNPALRTEDDVYVAGSVLGLERSAVRDMLAASPKPASQGRGNAPEEQERMRAIFAKMRSGDSLTEEEQKLAQEMRRRMAQRGLGRGEGGNRRGSRGSMLESQFGGDYLVFALRDGAPTAVRVRTGITDLDHVEIVSGLEEGDQVLILPSASLVRAQDSFQQRMSKRMGIPGLSRQDGSGGSRKS